jgi:N-acetylmuramoyl-L-alanine amidase
MPPGRVFRGAWPVAAAFACARPGGAPAGAPAPATATRPAEAPTASHLPEIPFLGGPLALRVIYPAAGAVVDARDSTFLHGSTGAGDAQLSINGQPVKVWPNGAWIAWVPLPADSLAQLELRARTPRDSVVLVQQVRPRPEYTPPSEAALWIDTTSLSPRGRLWARPDEYVSLSARAAPGAQLQLRLPPDGGVVSLVADAGSAAVPDAVRAFEWDTLKLAAAARNDRYRGLIRGRAIRTEPGPMFPGPATPALETPMLEAIRGADTVRVPWPLQIALLDTVPLVVQLEDDPRAAGARDLVTVGRAAPNATYDWFFPAGTRAVVSGRINDDLRLTLAPGQHVWVAAAEARPLPIGTPPPRGRAKAITIHAAADRVRARIPLGERIPFRTEEGDRRLTLLLYGAEADIDWIRYGPASGDSLVRGVMWTQEPGRVLRLEFELTQPVWGYRTAWAAADLVLEFRRVPRIDDGNPLKGRRIAVDPGHPPGGATGPTGLREADANLAVSLALARMLEQAGAEVILTRTADVPLDLGARVPLADSLGAELFVSIHQNALPDGLNPLANNGTSVFYNHPRSLPLARAIQRRLVQRLGLRDLGVARGDLAVTRGTWTPSVLTEGLHIIMPEQEAALRTEKGRELYARGVTEGIRDYLKAATGER